MLEFLENAKISRKFWIFLVSAVCSGLCVQVLQQSQLHKFHFEFFRLCGLQYFECASFTAVCKFHRRVAHLSSLRACSCFDIDAISDRTWKYKRTVFGLPPSADVWCLSWNTCTSWMPVSLRLWLVMLWENSIWKQGQAFFSCSDFFTILEL